MSEGTFNRSNMLRPQHIMTLQQRLDVVTDDGERSWLQQYITALQQRLDVVAVSPAAVPLELVADMYTTLEELHVADEELREQNEALIAARLDIEAERQRYQELFDFAPDGYLVTDCNGVIREANRMTATLLATRQDLLPGKPLALFVQKDAQAAFRHLLNRLQQMERVQEWEVHMQPRHGIAFAATLTIATIRNVQGIREGLRWGLHDSTLRKQAEVNLKAAHATLEMQVANRTAELQMTNRHLQAEIVERQRAVEHAEQAERQVRSAHDKLRHLAMSLQNAQEQERTHIARELHDNLAQMLTSLRLDVAWLSSLRLDMPGISGPVATALAERQQRLGSVSKTVDALDQAIHRIGTELRPTMLDTLGLLAAMEWQLQDMQQRAGLTYTLSAPAEELVLEQSHTTAVFRVFQEAILNVIRHAAASHVTVQLVQYPDAVLVDILDNGRGITPEQADDDAALGLLGMRERARLWGGDVTIQGTTGVGTRVAIYMPCMPEAPTTTTPVRIRVCVADDHATVREGIRRFLSETDDLTVTREAGTAQEIYEVVMARACDVVLLDISLPGRDGLEVLQDIKRLQPTLPVLMFSVHAEEQYAVRALKTGAAGYLSKSSAPEELVTALRTVAAGNRYITPAVAEHLAREVTAATAKPAHTALTNREYQVLRLLAAGDSVKEIAAGLFLSVKTISTYRTRILHKLHLKTTAELIRYALVQRLVEPLAASPS